jgi:hypothetical protein
MSRIAVGMLLLGFAGVALAGCSGGGPPPSVTIGDLNCARSAVQVSANAAADRVSPAPGSVYSVTVSVTVTCNGTGVEGASVSVGYWWGAVASETTDANGVATFPQQSTTGSQMPAQGPTVDVTVTPDAGDPFVSPATVTVTPPL